MLFRSETARNVRCSPVHGRLSDLGACFGVLSGWERPLWFGEPGERPVEQHSFGRSNAFERIAAEHHIVPGRASLLTS